MKNDPAHGKPSLNTVIQNLSKQPFERVSQSACLLCLFCKKSASVSGCTHSLFFRRLDYDAYFVTLARVGAVRLYRGDALIFA